MISKHKIKITIYYHSENSIGKQTHAYVNASDKKLHAVDISKTKVTGSQWAELATELGKNISDLINKEHPDFIQNYGKDKQIMEQHDWLKILEKMPLLLKHPIIINGNDYIEIKSASEVVKYLESGNEADKISTTNQ
ncbi:arsenate reductase family protein [Algibacter miyuki]|uniref:Arsenate reductase family protein n=1 Tax=Algibacter miyuki TaxID=1306933 RepID=A0ABV5H0H2_9FLAO|nr:ArsC/Spx/MgsR family protein [Algibacter miyuki]MDN3667367.1 ArsC/Spx/MgsR family protein [Algibacter miyuki]